MLSISQLLYTDVPRSLIHSFLCQGLCWMLETPGQHQWGSCSSASAFPALTIQTPQASPQT